MMNTVATKPGDMPASMEVAAGRSNCGAAARRRAEDGGSSPPAPALQLMLLLLIACTGRAAASPGWKAGNDVHVEAFPGGTFQTGPADWRFVDGFGRERLFRGINVVYKDPPWLPNATSFNTNFSWVEDDAKLLASMEPGEAEKAAENIIKNKLTVKDLSESNKNKKQQKTTKKQKQTDVILIEQEMSEAFGHQITIEAKTKQKGSLQISYKTSDELETIISKILSKNK